ncbi:MAG: Na(+)-translocating NADH-quinone reductase subunit A [Candidatus Latescibacterota bacterium]|nr:Na(+)-translocating NADH-quinone reductase subunit A [Candidatus Latescibacterota bacterium]
MGERRSFTIKKGLDLPITGETEQVIEDSRSVSRVAAIGIDFHGLRPTMHVSEGDSVLTGQLLFEDKRRPGVKFTAPGAGKVSHIHRGEKRILLSVIIDLDGEGAESFDNGGKRPEDLGREAVRDILVNSGLWTALRTRPFGKVPLPETVPSSIFATAIDTNPLAPDPAVVLNNNESAFENGLAALGQLTDGSVYLCRAPGSAIPDGGNRANITIAEFAGPHPAGLAGTHVHFLDPVGLQKTVFTIGYQDVVSVGKLFSDGNLYTTRVISIAGPAANRPRLLRTRLGASVTELSEGEAREGEVRMVAGSLLSGRTAVEPVDFLGRWHNQISLLQEGRRREFLGWQMPGADKFSVKNVFTSSLAPGKRFDFTTSTEGSVRAMVPVGSFESVMPLDILPTFLLRSLITRDAERSMALGCLELEEEDLGLCTFVCPGKTEYGPLLRQNLDIIEREF